MRRDPSQIGKFYLEIKYQFLREAPENIRMDSFLLYRTPKDSFCFQTEFSLSFCFLLDFRFSDFFFLYRVVSFFEEPIEVRRGRRLKIMLLY